MTELLFSLEDHFVEPKYLLQEKHVSPNRQQRTLAFHSIDLISLRANMRSYGGGEWTPSITPHDLMKILTPVSSTMSLRQHCTSLAKLMMSILAFKELAWRANRRSLDALPTGAAKC